jgi:mRNA interferase RelE/StbE
MKYSVEFTPQAEKDFIRLDKAIVQHIADKIDWLSENIEHISPAPLKREFQGKFKLRIGNWRVIYSFEQSSRKITVYAIKHRSEVYKV